MRAIRRAERDFHIRKVDEHVHERGARFVDELGNAHDMDVLHAQFSVSGPGVERMHRQMALQGMRN